MYRLYNDIIKCHVIVCHVSLFSKWANQQNIVICSAPCIPPKQQNKLILSAFLDIVFTSPPVWERWIVRNWWPYVSRKFQPNIFLNREEIQWAAWRVFQLYPKCRQVPPYKQNKQEEKKKKRGLSVIKFIKISARKPTSIPPESFSNSVKLVWNGFLQLLWASVKNLAPLYVPSAWSDSKPL